MGYSFAGPKSHHETIIEILGNLRVNEDGECPVEFQGLEWGLLMETIQDHVFGLQSQIDNLDWFHNFMLKFHDDDVPRVGTALLGYVLKVQFLDKDDTWTDWKDK